MAFFGLGVAGDIIMRLLFRSERQAQAAKAQQQENAMWHERLKEQRDANRELNDTIVSLTHQLSTQSEEIVGKNTLIRTLQDKRIQQEQRIAHLELIISSKNRYIDWLTTWHCSREQGSPDECPDKCDRRRPRQKIPVPYHPHPDYTQPEQTTPLDQGIALRLGHGDPEGPLGAPGYFIPDHEPLIPLTPKT